MKFQFHHLDDRVRTLMIGEIDADILSDKLYEGKQLTRRGLAAWPDALRAAAREGTPGSLTCAVARPEYWQARVPRHHADGRVTYAKVSSDAADRLAEGEFNRFYIRAVCLRAIADGLEIEIVRVKQVQVPRSESEAKIGTRVDPAALLRDLRENIGVDTAFGIPAGPNSGLSVCLVAPRAA